MTVAEPTKSKLMRVKRALPWLVGVVIIVVIATHVPFAQFRASIGKGPHLRLIAAEIVMAFIALCTDSLATWIGLLAAHIRWSLPRVIAVKGATYLLLVINYAVGQGGFGYYLYRAGEPALKAAGTTLFLLGTNLATLLLLTLGVWIATGGVSGAPAAMWWLLVIGSAGFGVYLILIKLRFPYLARRELLAPLFDAGLRGHALAVLGRIPHVVVIVLAYWVAMRAWGLQVPFMAAAVLMPAVALAGVLPISPAGLGTAQAALVFFFADYAPGATPDARSAAVLAFGIVHFVYALGSTLLMGLCCLPFSKRAPLVEAPAST